MQDGKVFGTKDQDSLVELYAKYVSKPKASFF